MYVLFTETMRLLDVHPNFRKIFSRLDTDPNDLISG